MDRYLTLYRQYQEGTIDSEQLLKEFSGEQIMEMSLPRRFQKDFSLVMNGGGKLSVGETLASLVKDMRREYLNRLAVLEENPENYSFLTFVQETIRSKTYKAFTSDEKQKFWFLVEQVSARLHSSSH